MMTFWLAGGELDACVGCFDNGYAMMGMMDGEWR